jgi:hypothetical protein
MKLEDCVARNRDVFAKFFETDEAKKYKLAIKSIKPYVTTLRSEGFAKLLIIKSAVTSLYVLIVDTEGSGEWLGTLSRQLSDPPELVAYNLAYFGLYNKETSPEQPK